MCHQIVIGWSEKRLQISVFFVCGAWSADLFVSLFPYFSFALKNRWCNTSWRTSSIDISVDNVRKQKLESIEKPHRQRYSIASFQKRNRKASVLDSRSRRGAYEFCIDSVYQGVFQINRHKKNKLWWWKRLIRLFFSCTFLMDWRLHRKHTGIRFRKWRRDEENWNLQKKFLKWKVFSFQRNCLNTGNPTRCISCHKGSTEIENSWKKSLYG